MRIRLFEGKQKELILLAKGSVAWTKLADELGLNDFYLRHELKNEKRLLRDDIFDKLCDVAGVDFSRFVEERLDDNWGRAKGGRESDGKLNKNVHFPEYSEELAEFYGAMLGDGNSNKVQNYKVGTYMIRIAGDLNLDRDYHLKYLKPLIEGLFGVKVKVFEHSSRKIRYLTVYSKLVVDFLEGLGFFPGDKIKNKLAIPLWIKKNKDYLCACLRGLYDTDGGIYGLNGQSTCQIAFTNHNRVLLDDVRDSLIELGMSPSKIVSGRRVYLTKKSELQKFLKQIGFSNVRHFEKFKMLGLAL